MKTAAMATMMRITAPMTTDRTGKPPCVAGVTGTEGPGVVTVVAGVPDDTCVVESPGADVVRGMPVVRVTDAL